MNISKVWVFVLGLLAGAVLLGDNGGDAVRNAFTGIRNATSNLAPHIGEQLHDLGDASRVE